MSWRDQPLAAGGDGALVANLMHFARLLRGAGLPIGPGRIAEAVRAVQAAGLSSRNDFYWTLHAVFVNRRDQRHIFDQAFRLFWRDPEWSARLPALSLLLPQARGADQTPKEPMSRRLAEALQGEGGDKDARPREDEPPGETFDAVMTWSAREVLRRKDFEQMSNDELARARAAMARLVLPVALVRTRRHRANPAGARADLRATLRATARTGGDIIALRFRAPRLRPPPLVVLCDISGSMERYSRMLLHFLHALAASRQRVHSFVFGTRLTNITRQLRHRDVDEALSRVAKSVEDWSGGTRIGHCLAEFNLRWGRRVLGQNAVALLITDGLDREGAQGLAAEMERLHKSCHRLIWLNPLLRYSGFEPKFLGARAMMPHVDDFRPSHNLQSLADIAQVLGEEAGHAMRPRFAARRTAA